ncbi:hypothetical protein [Deinococcus hopiensis]|uniref:hypothetical protein n=1 Tax=Deinococcus hopiensis TaxID=309885 RepID=UPI001FE8A4BC|nr:hypothetical protein [Deinococcus hopiensis]
MTRRQQNMGIAPALAEYWRSHSPIFERVFCSTPVRVRQAAETVALELSLQPGDLRREWNT